MENLFPYSWTLKNANFTKDKGTVFSCFAGAGGSTMGYKLAGFDVLGCNEIDRKMSAAYIQNHKPEFHFPEPIQEFKKKRKLPKKLFALDILDGSPPCSVFSLSGNREKDWGKKRKFAEGQFDQVLDTLFFDFIDLAERLRPKIAIAENVTGLLIGNASRYAAKIMERFVAAGYHTGRWVLDASRMGVPQRRRRVFFIGLRKDIDIKLTRRYGFFERVPDVDLVFNFKQIPYSEIEEVPPTEFNSLGKKAAELWKIARPGFSLSSADPKGHYFNFYKLSPSQPVPTMMSCVGDRFSHPTQKRGISKKEILLASTFPLDYDFSHVDPSYACGMSVPPVMVAQIASRVHRDLLSKIR